jgi:hypothetical protein
MQGPRRKGVAATGAVGLVLAAGVFLTGGVAVAIPTAITCVAANANHVTLVVEHGDGRAIDLCVGFNGPTITGEQILKQSGLEYGTVSYASLGDAVCQIDAEPASYPPSCLTSSSPYWASFVSRRGGPWSPASKGVSSETFSNGDAEGFRYDSQSGTAAEPSSPAGVCAAAAQHVTTTSAPAAATGINPSFLVAAAAAGALAALAALRALRRRRA